MYVHRKATVKMKMIVLALILAFFQCGCGKKIDTVKNSELPGITSCGMELDADRVIGGTNTYIDEFTWMGLINFKDTNGASVGFKCGGSIINRRYILTAAHCVNTVNLGIQPDFVRLGEWKLSTEEDCIEDEANDYCSNPVEDISIEKIVAHPQYNSSTANNDIAILRLARNIVFSDFIHPICLPVPDNTPSYIGTFMTASGWGITEHGNTSDIKQKVELPVIANEDCKKNFKKTEVSSNQMCAGGVEGKDTCQGDSGGPLMRKVSLPSEKFQWFQEGVVSRGKGCGKSFPAVYTKVSQYYNWILTQLED